MKDLMPVICLNFMHRGEGALWYLAQRPFLFMVGHSWGGGGHSKQFKALRGSGR